MTSFALDALPKRRDIANMYRLALGRDPEAEQIIDDRIHQPNGEWLPAFFVSEEFCRKVAEPIVTGNAISGGLFDEPPASTLVTWASEFLPLTNQGQNAVADAKNWYDLFFFIISDVSFAETILSSGFCCELAPFLRLLDERRMRLYAQRIEGAIERFSSTEIAGWAVDPLEPDRQLALVLDIGDERNAAVTTTDRFRQECRERFGGSGHNGFVLSFLPPRSSSPSIRATVKEAVTEARIGSVNIRADHAPIDEIGMLRHQLSSIREALDRIESRLPHVGASFGFPLESYDRFHSTYDNRRQYAEPLAQRAKLNVLIDASEIGGDLIDRCLASIAQQTHACCKVVVLHSAEATFLMKELGARWESVLGPPITLQFVTEPADAESILARPKAAGGSCDLVLVPPGFALREDALGRFAQTLGGGAVCAYADDDEVVAGTAGNSRYTEPVLRGAFDYDLLLQKADYLDTPIALASSLLERLGSWCGTGFAARFATLLRIAEVTRGEGLVHIDAVLAHRHERRALNTATLDACRATLAEHLKRVSSGACIEPESEPGGSVPARFRVAWQVPQGTRATIIIPTQDRLDLLEPCLASILHDLPKNRTQIDIIVVDHDSRDPRTHAFLRGLADRGPVRVLHHEGSFNWALMNNRAAAQSDADVLIFLNNDTLLCKPGIWDEMVATAMRSEVGAVGARLLYGDGSIQHAGVVLETGESFSSHEGMGRSAHDCGYLERHALVHRTMAVTGACLATRARLFREMRGYDGIGFPVEGNDTDYCLRLAANGYWILYNPHVTLYHLESRTRGYNVDDARRDMAEKAGRLLAERWGTTWPRDPFYNLHFDRGAAPFSRLVPL